MSTQTLPADPSVTITFDGLIMMVHDKARRLCQAGIHTQAPHHALQIEVRKQGEAEPVWPTKESPWDGSHRHIKSVAPLWLYVDSGQGRREEDFSADVYKPDDLGDRNSFGHVVDFEGALYKRPLGFRADTLAVLNVAHGVFYSANTEQFLLKSLASRQNDVTQAKFEKEIRASSLVAASIEARSGKGVERSIVLEQERPEGRVLFRFRLEEGVSYEINVKNVPEHDMHDVSVAAHFLQYYKLFPLKRNEKRFIVEPVVTNSQLESADSPPCNVGRGSLSDGLP